VNGVRIVLEHLTVQASGTRDARALESAIGRLAIIAARVSCAAEWSSAPSPLAPSSPLTTRLPTATRGRSRRLACVTMVLSDLPDHDHRPEFVTLFANLKAAIPQVQALLDNSRAFPSNTVPVSARRRAGRARRVR
jgi:hypothetical protein